ncbi:MAG: E3 binding domain-containing protein, partial [Chloroflexota bacterium]|nr:E3 binding domain-containing protein [Chloroflexota bacterium]
MATVIMPKMGDAMEEGTLLKWLKSAGDEVAEGDPIAEIETDKVTLEIEAPEKGFLTNTLVEEGATVPIGTAVATIGAEGDVGQKPDAPEGGDKAADVEESAVADAVEETPEPEAADEPVPADGPVSPVPSQTTSAASTPSQPQAAERKPGERLRASPLVKRLAEEHGIDLTQVTGSGPGGRIIKNDISDFVSGAKPVPQAADAAPQAPAPAATNGQADQPAASPESGPVPSASGKGTKVELARIRRTTGKRMAESKQTIPHYYVTLIVDM